MREQARPHRYAAIDVVDAASAGAGPAQRPLDEDDASIFIQLTELGLGSAPAAQTWGDLMAVDLSLFRSQTAQRLRGEGRTEERAEAKGQDILVLLGQRGVPVSDDVRERITACRDIGLLETWLVRAVTASSADDLFGD